MKPRFLWAMGLVLLLVPGLALADSDRALTMDDVLRLHFAGVSEEIILSEIIVTETVFELSVDDILRLKEAGVSERLLQFMIDTAIEPEEEWEYTDDEEADYLEDGGVWVNEIEEVEPTTTYHVSLNYSYPSWYYDCYWWDYWYWDFHYHPYRSSYVFHFGAWYPAWYSYRWCWSPPYWGHWSHHGYNNYYYAGHGYGYSDYYYAARRHESHSDVKYRGGSTRGGKPLFADAGLKVPDGSRPHVTGGSLGDRPRGKTRDGRLLLTDGKPDRPHSKYPVRRPTRTGRPADVDGVRKPPRTPTRRPALKGDDPVRKRRSVRSPADGGRPIKVRKVRRPSSQQAAPDRGVKPPTRRPTRESVKTPSRPPVKAKSTKKARADEKKPSPPQKKTVREAPKPSSRVSPAPRAPAPRPSPGVSRKAPPSSPSKPAGRGGGSQKPPSKKPRGRR